MVGLIVMSSFPGRHSNPRHHHHLHHILSKSRKYKCKLIGHFFDFTTSTFRIHFIFENFAKTTRFGAVIRRRFFLERNTQKQIDIKFFIFDEAKGGIMAQYLQCRLWYGLLTKY